MKNSVRLVTAALRGQIAHDANWWTILATANKAWLAPDLFLSLQQAGQLASIPGPVRDYLAFIHAKNLERNARLRTQLLEAARILNDAGIEPVLLKGAIHLFDAAPPELGRRMISDLDLAMAPAEIEPARAALGAIGYLPTQRSNELGRLQDAGTIELHAQANRRSLPYLSGDVRTVSKRTVGEGASVHVPGPTARALHLIVHDMIKDGDYWRHTLDLRHLRDLARMAPQVDWDKLGSVLHDWPGRPALELQSIALCDLFQVAVPPALCTARARRRHALRLRLAEDALGATLIRSAGKLSWGFHRFATRRRKGRSGSIAAAIWDVLAERPNGSRL